MPPNITPVPADAASRRAAKPAIVYPAGTMPGPDMATLEAARRTAVKTHELIVPPRDALTFRVARGQFFRIVSIEGPQVGDLNLWNADDLSERFFSGKTRALHGTHVGLGDRLWSNMPYLRPMATISHDTLGWYGFDADGAGIHDVIGTRCDPYTNLLLNGTAYDFCCHSNLSRALASELKADPAAVEHHVHDVLNVFMCTGFTGDTRMRDAEAQSSIGNPCRAASRELRDAVTDRPVLLGRIKHVHEHVLGPDPRVLAEQVRDLAIQRFLLLGRARGEHRDLNQHGVFAARDAIGIAAAKVGRLVLGDGHERVAFRHVQGLTHGAVKSVENRLAVAFRLAGAHRNVEERHRAALCMRPRPTRRCERPPARPIENSGLSISMSF